MKVFFFSACLLFYAHFHALPLHGGGAEIQVHFKLVQDFSTNYHVVLAEGVGHVCTMVSGGRWIEFGHFEMYMAFSAGGNFVCYYTQFEMFFTCF